MKIGMKADTFVNGGGNHPPFLLPFRFAAEANHIHHGSVAQGVMQHGPVGSNEHGVGNLHDAGRHIRYRQKRTKRDLANVVDGFVSEDTGPYPGGAAVTTDQNVAGACLSVSESRDDLFAVLLQSLEAVVEKDAVGIVAKHSGGECRMKIRAMNLVKGSAESLEVVW